MSRSKQDLAAAYAKKRNGGKMADNEDFLSGEGDDQYLADNEAFLDGHDDKDSMSEEDPTLFNAPEVDQDSPMKRLIRKRMQG